MSAEPWVSPDSFVSQYNFYEEAKRGLKMPSRVSIHDTTLRDGEQQTGIVFQHDEKLSIARMLDEAGVARIEAGMPAVSAEEQETIKQIAHLGLQADVVAFSRCMKQDVELARKCDVKGVVMEIPSSHHLIEYAYGWTVEKAIDLSVEATQYARDHGLTVGFFTIDSTRAPESYWKIIEAVSSQGHMDTLAIVDTFGVFAPHSVSYFVEKVKERISKPLEFHGHNDFGLGVANATAAVASGVDIIHTTVNGIGERVGNTSLEEAVMALKLLYRVETGVRTETLHPLSKLVQQLSEVTMPPNKPVVGDNVFTTESGIVGGWWTKLESLGMITEMFPFTPQSVGHGPIRIAVGKKSGRESLLYKVKKQGLKLEEKNLDDVLQKVKKLAVTKKRVLTDEEIAEIVDKSNRQD